MKVAPEGGFLDHGVTQDDDAGNLENGENKGQEEGSLEGLDGDDHGQAEEEDAEGDVFTTSKVGVLGEEFFGGSGLVDQVASLGDGGVEFALEAGEFDGVTGTEDLLEKIGLVSRERWGWLAEFGEKVVFGLEDKTGLLGGFDLQVFLAGEVDDFGDDILGVDFFVEDGTGFAGG